ncbi:hypothetical protein Tco_1147638 [Tanacetum coccineum]
MALHHLILLSQLILLTPKPQFIVLNQIHIFSKQAQSTAKRPFYKQTAFTRRFVHAAKGHYYTRRHNAVNTARASHNMMIKDDVKCFTFEVMFEKKVNDLGS